MPNYPLTVDLDARDERPIFKPPIDDFSVDSQIQDEVTSLLSGLDGDLLLRSQFVDDNKLVSSPYTVSPNDYLDDIQSRSSQDSVPVHLERDRSVSLDQEEDPNRPSYTVTLTTTRSTTRNTTPLRVSQAEEGDQTGIVGRDYMNDPMSFLPTYENLEHDDEKSFAPIGREDYSELSKQRIHHTMEPIHSRKYVSRREPARVFPDPAMQKRRVGQYEPETHDNDERHEEPDQIYNKHEEMDEYLQEFRERIRGRLDQISGSLDALIEHKIKIFGQHAQHLEKTFAQQNQKRR